MPDNLIEVESVSHWNTNLRASKVSPISLLLLLLLLNSRSRFYGSNRNGRLLSTSMLSASINLQTSGTTWSGPSENIFHAGGAAHVKPSHLPSSSWPRTTQTAPSFASMWTSKRLLPQNTR